MRSAGLRNKPVDRRYLRDKRSDPTSERKMYNQSGEYGNAARALSRARQYRGQQAYSRNTPPNTQGRTPGTGGFTGGLGVQQARFREMGVQRNPDRFENLASYKAPSNKGDLFKPDDPA